MDWYYGCENSNFLAPKDQEGILERHPSPYSWSEWGINAHVGFNSPQECLFMDTDETEVQFNFIYESFKNEIEFDHCRYDKDQSSSSSSCGESHEQLFQQTALSCDHQPEYQLQDLSEPMDDLFLDSGLEDFPCVESLHKSFFYPENQCSNTTVGVQKDIAASEFLPSNSDSKDCLDIEMVKVLDLFQQSNGDETMHGQFSVEEFTLLGFQMSIARFTEKTRIRFRDALYRLARNVKQHVVDDLDGDFNMYQAMSGSLQQNHEFAVKERD